MTKTEVADPINLFAEWYDEAANCDLREPTSAALASADADGRPSVRMVLLKAFNAEGFVIYTNLRSRKGNELIANPRAALCFYWMPIRKQVRIEGQCTQISDAEADLYFATRQRDSQIGAWASRQSEPLISRFDLEKGFARKTLEFGVNKIPRPKFWSGFRIHPERVEFWHQMPFRLHDRKLFIRVDDGWKMQRLYP